MSYPTTKKQYEIFLTEAARWIDFLGLYDWRITFVHEEWKGHTNVRGWATADWPNGVVTIGFNKKLEEKITDEEVRTTARHEILELLLWPMYEVATDRYTTPDIINTARHKVIRTIESALDRLTSG